jgi:hypothetical protein
MPSIVRLDRIRFIRGNDPCGKLGKGENTNTRAPSFTIFFDKSYTRDAFPDFSGGKC